MEQVEMTLIPTSTCYPQSLTWWCNWIWPLRPLATSTPPLPPPLPPLSLSVPFSRIFTYDLWRLTSIKRPKLVIMHTCLVSYMRIIIIDYNYMHIFTNYLNVITYFVSTFFCFFLPHICNYEPFWRNYALGSNRKGMTNYSHFVLFKQVSRWNQASKDTFTHYVEIMSNYVKIISHSVEISLPRFAQRLTSVRSTHLLIIADNACAKDSRLVSK